MILVDIPAERKGRVGVADDKSKAFCIRAVFNHSGREGMAYTSYQTSSHSPMVQTFLSIVNLSC